MKPHLQCAEQQVSRSNLTKYCACHAERLTYLVLITYETSFTVRGATGVTIQPHQILRLPRKIALQNFWQNLWKQMKRHFQCGDDPRMIRPWSEHDPTMIRPWKRKPQPASQPRLLFELTTSIFYWKIQRFAPNLTFKHSPSAAPATKSNTWTSPSTAPATKSNTWTSPSTAPATKCDTWTSPNTAPATKNDSHAWSSSHMKRHLQCAEQQVSPSNLTKYCACHTEWLACLIVVTYETSFTMRGATGVTIQPHQILRLSRRKTRILSPHHIWNLIYNARSNRCHDPTSPNTAPATKNDTARFQRKSPKTGETSFPMRGRSDHDPSMIRPWSDHENANRNPPRNRGYFSTSPQAFSIVKYNVSRPILHSNLHQILRLPRKVPLELHQILRLPRKVTLELHQVLRLPRKVTLELHQVLHLPRKVTLELHQVLCLPLYCNWTLL